MAVELRMELIPNNNEIGENEEEKHAQLLNDNQSESGSESKEEQLPQVYEIDLERQKYIFTMNWTPCKVRINRDTASVSIDNHSFFMDYAGIANIPLNKCTISYPPMDSVDKIQYLQLLYHNDDNTVFATKFRLPDGKREQQAEILKFNLFAATLHCHGLQFERLKSCLVRWNNGHRKMSKSEIIEIFKVKYEYDLFEGRHQMNEYVYMIENMNEKVIKVLQSALTCTEFSKQEPEEWRERCKNALEIEHKWKILSAQMRVQLDKICQISKCGATASYGTVAKYENVQKILKQIAHENAIFCTDLLQKEITAWKQIALKYLTALQNENANNSKGHQWKIAVGVVIALVGIVGVIGLFVCPLSAVTSGVAATAATSTVFVNSTWWVALGLGSMTCLSGMALCAYGVNMYMNLPTDHKIFKEVETVLELWEQFKSKYLKISHDVHYIANKDMDVQGPGCMWNEIVSEIIKQNVKEIGKMSKKCISKIQKTR